MGHWNAVMQSSNCQAQLAHMDSHGYVWIHVTHCDPLWRIVTNCDTCCTKDIATTRFFLKSRKARQSDWHGRSHSSLGDQLPFLVCRWKGGAAWNVMWSRIPFEKQMCSKALSWTEDLRFCSQFLTDVWIFQYVSNCCNARYGVSWRFTFALLHPSFWTM